MAAGCLKWLFFFLNILIFLFFFLSFCSVFHGNKYIYALHDFFVLSSSNFVCCKLKGGMVCQQSEDIYIFFNGIIGSNLRCSAIPLL